MNLLKKRTCVALIFVILLNGCGYKLGGLEVIGENSSKTAVLKVTEALFVFFVGPESVRKLAPSNAATRLLVC